MELTPGAAPARVAGDCVDERRSSTRSRAAGGARISGPGALSGGWRRMSHLAWTLAYLEFRLKFFGSVLGYLWQLGRPLMLFGVYYVLFTQFVTSARA